MQLSQFHFYSIGVAAEHKALGSKQLLCTPTEVLNMLDGQISEGGTVTDVTGTDADGKAFANRVVSANALQCTWMAGDGFRLTAPDVRRGEEVEIWSFGDTGRFFWRPRGTNANSPKEDGSSASLRKLETIIFGISAGTVDGTEPSGENMYLFELSSHSKKIMLTTSQANGEVCAYQVEINPGEGRLVGQDSQGNQVRIDSMVPAITLLNADDTEVELTGADLNVTVPGNQTNTVEGNFTINVNGNAAIHAAGNADVTAGGKASVTAPAIDLNGDTSINGSLKITGPTEANGITSPLPISGPSRTI